MTFKPLIVAMLSLYAVLWGATAALGTSDVRVAVSSAYDYNLVDQDDARSYMDAGEVGLRLDAFSPAPFLVSAASTFACGPQCGHAERGLYIWLPGGYVALLGSSAG